MGFRAPEEAPPTFLVTGPTRAFSQRIGQTGVSFDGQRRDVTVADIIAAEGRRTPDSTVSQRHFRFAFVFIIRQGSVPPQSSLDQIDVYRRQFELYYRQATSDRATADTALRMSLRLSTFPAAGLIAGRSATATVSIQKPVAAPLPIALRTLNGAAAADASVTIPAGGTSASLNLSGLRAGVDELSAQPADSRYDAAVSRTQVLGGPDDAQLALIASDGSRVTLRVHDVNNLPYPGVPVTASILGATSVAISDSSGRVSFESAGGPMSVQVAGASGALIVSGAFSFSAPVNAASGAPGLAPGEIASMYGSRLAGAQVLLDGHPATALYTTATQLNFVVPPEQAVGSTQVTIVSGGVSVDLPTRSPVTLFSPGIFFDAATGFAVIGTKDQRAARGDLVEIYATGLGPAGDATPEVTIGGIAARVTGSSLSPDQPGLYRVTTQIPPGAASGEQTLQLRIGGVTSNIVKIGVQ